MMRRKSGKRESEKRKPNVGLAIDLAMGAWSAEFRIVGSICLFVEFTGADDVAPERSFVVWGGDSTEMPALRA